MWTRIIRNSATRVYLLKTNRHFSSSSVIPKVCIVGSGPAGFYTAQHLIKNDSTIEIDMYEKLPVPFGLVRYGVAPDHPDVKNVINTFTNVAKSGRLHFIGNVTIGQDVTLSHLRAAYDVVVLAYGAAQDRWLGIPGENLKNVVSARKFVGWYNGLPEDKGLDFDLDVETAVIIGQGNVAIDVARILLTPIDILKKTDIAQHALDRLSRSRIRNVKIIGRRGPLQVAFTIKELREMLHLPETSFQIHVEERESIEKLLSLVSRPRKRLTELMLQSISRPEEQSTRRCWELLFNRAPVEIFSSPESDTIVAGLVVSRNRLEGDWQDPRVVDTGEKESIPAGLILKSIGYKSLPLAEELPFDHARGVIRQKDGRVVGMPGVFCSGWVASGPVGVIASTLQSGHDVGRRILEDLNDGVISVGNAERGANYRGKEGKGMILPLLASKGVEPVTFIEWEMLDREERERGKQLLKPREKIVDVKEMLDIAKKPGPSSSTS